MPKPVAQMCDEAGWRDDTVKLGINNKAMSTSISLIARGAVGSPSGFSASSAI